MVTIKDVAQDAQVAVGTVSKVINGQYVSAKNKEKVEASIAKLGYQINYYARGLKMRRTYTIAVIVPEILHPFYATWVYYIEKALYQQGYKMLLCNTQGMEEKEEYYFKMASQNKVDGIICISYRKAESYVSESIPIISLDRHFEKKVSCICSDNYHGGEVAAEQMISTGSRQLIYMWSGSKIPGETAKRERGFCDYCRSKGVDCEVLYLGDDYELFESRKSKIEETVYQFLVTNRVEGKLRYDGIYASTDWLALIILEQMKKIGIRVPEETQLIGHDGLRWMNWGDYMLSTIVQPVEGMAEKSVELIIKKIQGEDIDILTMLPITFAPRGTTR